MGLVQKILDPNAERLRLLKGVVYLNDEVPRSESGLEV